MKDDQEGRFKLGSRNKYNHRYQNPLPNLHRFSPGRIGHLRNDHELEQGFKE